MSADPLLQPFQLKHLTIRNRLMSTAHEPAYTHDGMPKERYRAYHVEKAKGGIGLTMIGGSAVVAPDSPQAFGNILLYKDEAVGWLKALADEVHDHGAAVMIQITHLGRRTSWAKDDWLPILSASHVREPAHRAFPKAMEDFDIARVVAAFADAAERVKAAGLDGFELEAYGHLIDQFWSPLTNHRNDEYGGGLENRMRFGFEVLRAIRDRVGPDFIVGARLVCDEDVERGLDKREGTAIAQALTASGLIDFVNVIRGHIDTEEGLSRVIPGMGERSAPHLDFAGEIRAATRLPTFHAARVQDVATARHAIESGKLDLVGMTRAHLADPHIALKIKQGREHEIRPCVGMGYCIDSIYSGHAVCIHNAATGRELTMPHVVARSDGPLKRFVVVGAGPGGLEAARVAAARGHKVVLMEAADAPGGQVRVAAGLARRREILGIVDWRVAQCEKHGVELRTNLYAEAEDVAREGADVVIVATGGVPNLDFLRGGAEHVVSSWDILTGVVKPAANVIVYDDNGAHAGVSVAEFCARAGANVDYMTPERMLGPDVGSTSFPPYLRAFSAFDVGVTLNLRLERVRRDGNRLVATFYDEYGPKRVERLADQIIVDHGATPVDDLYFALKAGSRNLGEVDQPALLAARPQTLVRNSQGAYQLFRIGDAVASRNIHAAIYDALRLVSLL
ncbi:MAG: NADH:flavin oxidoreductase [Pseudomonadota bacterium]|nr:NADH:flavin oxidoreductase [Pseudomonadota bacterium]